MDVGTLGGAAVTIPRWEIVVAWVLRSALLATAVALLVSGNWGFGVFCIVALALAIVPTIVARTTHFVWPLELEVVLLWLVLAHVGLGHVFHLYLRIELFDKILHLADSVLIGFVAFLAVYLANYLRHDRSHPVLDGIAIFLITLGLGALWEIAEFAGDQLLGMHAQGSPEMGPLTDTMWDLIMDGFGGVLAAVLGPIYMKHSRKSRARVAVIAARVRA